MRLTRAEADALAAVAAELATELRQRWEHMEGADLQAWIGQVLRVGLELAARLEPAAEYAQSVRVIRGLTDTEFAEHCSRIKEFEEDLLAAENSPQKGQVRDGQATT